MNAHPDFELALDQALDALAAGQAPEAILARFRPPAFPAHYAADLAPLLEAAQRAQAGLAAPVPAPNLARGRRRFLQAAQARPRATRAFRLNPALGFVLAVVFIGLLAYVPWASAAALPGDGLYPVKRAIENVQAALAAPDQRAAVAEALAARRRDEAARLTNLRRAAQLSFEGTVERVERDRLSVSGLTVLTREAAAFNPGDRVAVEARSTTDGTLIATRLTLLRAAPVTPTPTPSPTHPRPTATPPTRVTSTQPPAPATRVPPTRPAASATPPPARPTATSQPARTRQAEPSATVVTRTRP